MSKTDTFSATIPSTQYFTLLGVSKRGRRNASYSHTLLCNFIMEISSLYLWVRGNCKWWWQTLDGAINRSNVCLSQSQVGFEKPYNVLLVFLQEWCLFKGGPQKAKVAENKTQKGVPVSTTYSHLPKGEHGETVRPCHVNYDSLAKELKWAEDSKEAANARRLSVPLFI